MRQVVAGPKERAMALFSCFETRLIVAKCLMW